jgi:hypothetical protein
MVQPAFKFVLQKIRFFKAAAEKLNPFGSESSTKRNLSL